MPRFFKKHIFRQKLERDDLYQMDGSMSKTYAPKAGTSFLTLAIGADSELVAQRVTDLAWTPPRLLANAFSLVMPCLVSRSLCICTRYATLPFTFMRIEIGLDEL